MHPLADTILKSSGRYYLRKYLSRYTKASIHKYLGIVADYDFYQEQSSEDLGAHFELQYQDAKHFLVIIDSNNTNWFWDTPSKKPDNRWLTT